MDKFINTATGGIPDYNDDFRFSDDAIRNAMFGLYGDFEIGTSTNFIISGVDTTITPATNCVVTAGYVQLGGEILEVEAQTVARTLGTDIYVIKKVTSTDSAGDRNTLDGTPITPYQKNRGVVFNLAGAPSPADLDLTITNNRLRDKMANKIANSSDFYREDWNDFTLSGSATLGAGGYAKYRKDAMGYLEIALYNVQDAPDITTFAQLPAGYRPDNDVTIPVYPDSPSGSLATTLINIDSTTGNILQDSFNFSGAGFNLGAFVNQIYIRFPLSV